MSEFGVQEAWEALDPFLKCLLDECRKYGHTHKGENAMTLAGILSRRIADRTVADADAVKGIAEYDALFVLDETSYPIMDYTETTLI